MILHICILVHLLIVGYDTFSLEAQKLIFKHVE